MITNLKTTRKRVPAKGWQQLKMVVKKMDRTLKSAHYCDGSTRGHRADRSDLSRILKKSPAPAGPWMHRFSDQGQAVFRRAPSIAGEGIVKESLLGFFSCTGSCFALCWFGLFSRFCLLWLGFRYALFLCGFNHLLFQLPLSDGFWYYRVDRDDNETNGSIRF